MTIRWRRFLRGLRSISQGEPSRTTPANGEAGYDRWDWAHVDPTAESHSRHEPDDTRARIQPDHSQTESGIDREPPDDHIGALRREDGDPEPTQDQERLHRLLADGTRPLAAFAQGVAFDGAPQAFAEPETVELDNGEQGPPQDAPPVAAIFETAANAPPEAIMKVEHASTWALPAPPVRLIAFYLPQYHPFKENDEWWGAGFTEWTNVTRARPQFEGHYQPQRPGEFGYYDLRVPEVQERQAELARIFGVSGFCFYFYWFNGHVLMERPIRQFADNPNIDFPFCLCWANENWTRTWDGKDTDILIEQNYDAADDDSFIIYTAKYLKHRNYIRVDGKPLLIIYRVELLPDPNQTLERWRRYSIESGVGELYIVSTESFVNIDPAIYGLDAALEFPPNNIALNDVTTTYTGGLPSDLHIFDYNYSVEQALAFRPPVKPLIRGIFPRWDNTPRRGPSATLFINSTPAAYRQYVETVSKQIIQQETIPDRRLAFINAWNEWGEGARLEPDEQTGYAYLEATRMALIRASASDQLIQSRRYGAPRRRPRLAVIVHAFYLDVLPEIVRQFHAYPEDACFFFTTPPERLSDLAASLVDFRHDFEIFPVPNRGRDIAPFLRVLVAIWSRNFQYILKLHTKKSVYREDGADWRRDMIDTLATAAQVEAILAEMDKDETLGIVGPRNHILAASAFWGANRERVHALGARMGVAQADVEQAVFVAGTMFFARLEALEPLMGLSLTNRDFEAEEGQADGTLSHAIERAIGCSAQASGMGVRGASRHAERSQMIVEGAATVYAHADSSASGTP